MDAELCDDFAMRCAYAVAVVEATLPAAERVAALLPGGRIAAWRSDGAELRRHIGLGMELREAEYFWWAGCYVLWPAAAQRLVARHLPVHAPTDVALSELFLRRSLRALVPVPRLAWADNETGEALRDGVVRDDPQSDILHTNRYKPGIVVEPSLQAALDAHRAE